MNKLINIPAGRFAGEDAASRMKAQQRARIAKALREGDIVPLAKGGDAMDKDPNAVKISTARGKLAGEDAASRMKAQQRARIAKALREGDIVPLAKGGDAMDKDPNAVKISTARGKLAAQWYELDPNLLIMEKLAMARNFPQFKIDKLDDGRLCWLGILEPGIYESKFGKKRQYYVMAVYDNNHPNQKMGSSVKVYPLMPDVDELIEFCGFRPFHLLTDEVGNHYLCTNEAGDQLVGATKTTAAVVLGWASKWLMAYELVLTGDLTLAEFNHHGGI
ncbi:MAG: hypothetical protein NC082_04030 [Clostridiales bacterium]|nr:hypothetical protein [Clostridiales bacterium]